MDKVLLFVFLGSIVLSCSKKIRKDLSDGEYVIEHYKNDSIKNGKSTVYFENGEKQRIIKYRNNVMVGEMKYYHNNGKIASKTHFKDGKVKDKFYNFHKNGKPCNTYIYAQNKLIGIENCYDGNGNLLNCGTLKSGTGTINQYNIEGEIIAIDYMQDGRYIKTDSIK